MNVSQDKLEYNRNIQGEFFLKKYSYCPYKFDGFKYYRKVDKSLVDCFHFGNEQYISIHFVFYNVNEVFINIKEGSEGRTVYNSDTPYSRRSLKLRSLIVSCSFRKHHNISQFPFILSLYSQLKRI